MQPTLFDPINDTTAAAEEEEESVGPIRNDISGGGGGSKGEREKYNDGDDKSQVGLMIERKRRKEKMGKRNELMMVTGENIATSRERGWVGGKKESEGAGVSGQRQSRAEES